MNSNLKNFIKYHYIATSLELRKQYIKKVSKARTEFFFKSPLFSVNTYSIQLYLMWIMYNSVHIIT